MQFIGSSYTGECTADGKRAHRYGEFTFANGDKYVGEFKDGVMHGHGVIFYKKHKNSVINDNNKGSSNSKNDDKEENASLHREREREEEEWDGQYRGVWQNGVNVSGCYVFADGLVYGGESSECNSHEASMEYQKQEEVKENKHVEKEQEEECALSPSSQSTQDATKFDVVNTKSNLRSSAPDKSIAAAWPYCQSDDHRLWNEHLRNLIPVLPYETALGGTALQDEREQAIFANTYVDNDGNTKDDSNAININKDSNNCWSLTPNFVPTYCETEMTPPAFAQQQPRIPSDLPLHWWNYEKNKTQTLRTMSTLAQHTEPLIPEHDPDEYPMESHCDALGNEIESKQRQGHTIDVPNFHRLYPMSIIDGGRRLTPALSSTQGYKYLAHVQGNNTNTITNSNDVEYNKERDETRPYA